MIEAVKDERWDHAVEMAAAIGLAVDGRWSLATLISKVEVERERLQRAHEHSRTRRFTVDQLIPYSDRLFSVPGQVLVGARAAGLLADGCTKEEASEAVAKWLAMPAGGGS